MNSSQIGIVAAIGVVIALLFFGHKRAHPVALVDVHFYHAGGKP